MAEGTEDQFELRLKLTKYIKSISNPQTLKFVSNFCLKNENNCEIIWECMLENLKEDYKNRRAVLALLESLVENHHSTSLGYIIERNLLLIFDIVLPEDKVLDPIWYKNAAKGLQGLLKCFPDSKTSKIKDYSNRIGTALGLSDSEQLFLKKKQNVLDQIEKDRELHRNLREACWSRNEEESMEDEFLVFLHQSKAIQSRTINQSVRNNSLFENLNNIKRDLQRSLSIIVVHLEEVLLDIRRYRSDRNPKIRHCAEDVYENIKLIAKNCFFYSDLKLFDQPHVQYYNDDDDGKNLSSYDFKRDELSRFANGEVNDAEPRFYRERAYRYRLSSFRYSSSSELDRINYDHQRVFVYNSVELIPREVGRTLNRLLKEMDFLLNDYISKTLSNLEKLIQRQQQIGVDSFCFITDEHLSIALARNVALNIERDIPAISLYSTTKYDLGWILSQIKLKYNRENNNIYILGNSFNTKKEAEKIGGSYVRIGRPSDIEHFSDELVRRTTSSSP